MKQVLSRLFPFQRGLMHTYWAGNAWALYSFLDKILRILLFRYRTPSINQSSLGVTKDTGFDFLPSVTPLATIICILVSLIPLMIAIWKAPSRKLFLYYLSYAIYSFFFFGYHVHEKAILMVLVTYHAMTLQNSLSLEISLWLRISTAISMYPLLTEYAGKFCNNTSSIESPIKYGLLMVDFTVFVWTVMESIKGTKGNEEKRGLNVENNRRMVWIAIIGIALALVLMSIYWINQIFLS